MASEPQQQASDTRGKSANEALDALNSELREKGEKAARQQLEAGVEEEAKRRRESEKPVSEAFKKT